MLCKIKNPFFNPNRSLETETILDKVSCTRAIEHKFSCLSLALPLFYCRADWSLFLLKAWRATSRQDNGQDADKRAKAVGKPHINIKLSPMRSNDRLGFNSPYTPVLSKRCCFSVQNSIYYSLKEHLLERKRASIAKRISIRMLEGVQGLRIIKLPGAMREA